MKLERQTTRSRANFAQHHPDHADPKVGKRYGEWLHAARRAGLLDIEQVVDFYEVPFKPPVAETYSRENLTDEAAQALLRKVGPGGWGYNMPLSPDFSTQGRVSQHSETAALAKRRADYRLNMIFTGVEQVLEGGVKGRTLLDIACNWGGFSVEGRLRGARNVVGFDIREGNVNKAKLLLEHYGLDGISFRQMDLYQFQPKRQFDVVFNLGLMYHITQPVEMMKKTYDLTREIAVIDTVTHKEAFSGFVLGTGVDAAEHAATAVGMELHPTYRGLVDLAYLVGFKDVVEVHGIPEPDWQGFETEPYGNKTRRCIICTK